MFKTVLRNGLKLIVEENHSAPVVAVQVGVGVGSADEAPLEAGLAHVHEHMLFQGTDRRRLGEIVAEIEQAGGVLDASTGLDQTLYAITIARRELDVALEVLADVVQNATFDSDVLAQELEVILEELGREQDDPSRLVRDMLLRAAYPTHPYGRPVIGSAETVRSFTRDQVQAFYRRWYHPRNMVLVVVGDVEPNAVARRAEAIFGVHAADPTAVRPPPRPIEPPLLGLLVAKRLEDVAETHLAFAWPGLALRHLDAPALDVLAALLGGSESARLFRRMQRERAWVRDCSCFSFTPRDPGLFVVRAAVPGADVELAYEALLRECLGLRAREVEPSELERAKTLILAEALYAQETVQGVARKLAEAELLAGDPAFADQALARMEAVTAEDVRRLAQSTLNPETMVVAALLPHTHPHAMEREAVLRIHEAVKADLAREASSARRRRPSEPGPSGVERVRLSNGATLLVQEDRAVPLVSLCAIAQGGTLTEDARTNGVSQLVGALLTRGTQRFSAEQRLAETDAIAGSISAVSGKDALGLHANFLSRSFARGLELFASCLLEPTFPMEEIEVAKREQLEALASNRDVLSAAVFDLFSATLYETHPYRFPVLGTTTSVSGLTRDDLVSAYRTQLSPERLKLALVGDIDRAEAIEAIERGIGRAPPFEDRTEIPHPHPPEPPRAPRVARLRREKRQAHMVLGFLGVSFDDERRFALDVLARVLGGQSGRLPVELRYERPLAYAISAVCLEGLDPACFAVYAATSPEKLEAVEREIRSALERVRSEEISPDELSTAQRYLTGAHARGLQRVSARASALALNEVYGIGLDGQARYVSGIESVTPQRVREVAQEIIDFEAMVQAIIAPGPL